MVAEVENGFQFHIIGLWLNIGAMHIKQVKIGKEKNILSLFLE